MDALSDVFKSGAFDWRRFLARRFPSGCPVESLTLNECPRTAGGERDERDAHHPSVLVDGWLRRANFLIDARAGINQAEASKECQNAVSRRERERPEMENLADKHCYQHRYGPPPKECLGGLHSTAALTAAESTRFPICFSGFVGEFRKSAD